MTTGSRQAIVVRTESPEQTRAVGVAIGRTLAAGMVISLEGPLGAGKTVIAGGICEGLGVAEPVTSPTYTLRHDHVGRAGRPVIHLDCFRLGGPAELEELGVDECLDEGATILVEWGERALAALPPETIRIRLEPEGELGRRIEIRIPPGTVLPGLGESGPGEPGPGEGEAA